MNIKFVCLIAPLVSALLVGHAEAQGACPPGVPSGVFCGERNAGHATAGSYAIDPDHSAVLARISHIGYSYIVIRFDKLEGAMKWDPAAPEKSSMTITVKTGSLSTPVKDFAPVLTGEPFLNAAKFPDATFVSTAFKPAGATLGKVEGNLTLLGKTAPVTFDVELVGAGKGFSGAPRIGASARAWIKPSDFGMTPMLDRPIEIVTDIELSKTP